MTADYVVVFATAESEEQGKRIAEVLLEKKLIACANIVKDVDSHYWWKGRVEHSAELILVMKSRGELLEEIVKVVKENHSYEVPEVVALPIVGGNPDYLRWIDETVNFHQRGESG
jgi:periplasmic divalent cation tolerance protein